MANKKIFEIKINGLDESAKAAHTLAEQLAALEKEGKSLKDLKINVTGNAKRETSEVVKNINDIKKTKVTVSVGGVAKEFDNVKQALKSIKDEMVSLELEGKKNTDTYQELSNVYQDFALRAQDAQQAVGLLVTHTPELQNMLSIFKGFTAMASVGQGISNLLGIDNDEVQESINKMTSLIGVLEGISKLQEEINSASAFAKLFQSINDGITKVNSRVVSGVKNLGSYISNLLGIKRSGQAAAQGLSEAATAGQQASTGLAAAGEGARAGAAGINLMKAASRTFWLFALIEAIVKLTEWLSKGIKSLYQWVTGANDAAKASDIFKNKIDAMNSSTERFNKVVESMQARGLISSLEASSLMMEKTKKNISELLNQINKLNETPDTSWFTEYAAQITDWISGLGLFGESTNKFWQKNEEMFNSANEQVKTFAQNISLVNKTPEIDLSNWDKVEKKYTELTNRVIKGEKKAQNELVTIQESIIKEYENRYRAVDQSSQESIESFQKWVAESSAVENSLANLDKLFDSPNGEKYRELIKQIGIQMDSLSNQVNQAAIKIKEIQDKTEDNRIASIRDGSAKRIAEIRRATNKELEEYNLYRDKVVEGDKNLEALRLSILKKEKMQEQDIYTQAGNELYQIQKRIRDNNLYAEKRGYELRIAQLKNAMVDELREAQRSGKLVKEQELSIRQKYNSQIQEEERKHYENITKLLEEQTRRKLTQDISDMTAYIQNEVRIVEQFFTRLSSFDKIDSLRDEINKFKKDVQDLEAINGTELFNKEFFDNFEKELYAYDKNYRSIKSRLEQGFEFDPSKQAELVEERFDKLYKDLEYRRKEYTDKEYNNEKEKLDNEYALSQNANIRQLDMEQQFANQEIKLNETKYKTLYKLQEELYRNEEAALMNQERQRNEDAIRSFNEQYRNGEFKNKQEFDKLMENEEKMHQERLASISEQSRQKLMILEKDYNQKMLEDRNKSVNAQIKAFSELQNTIQTELSNITIVPNNDLMRFLEIGDIVQYKKAWEIAANDITVAIQKIDADLEQLSKDSVRNKDLIQYLQNMKRQLQKQLKGMGIKDMWLSIYKESINAYKSIADAFVSQLSSLLNTLNETALQLIDNQLAYIERELEIQQEAYDRAEECAQKHKDKMDSIEDELAESRGARREALISSLMEQEKAYLEDLSAQQHAAQEKEKLEKQQESLEKKRQEQEKKAKVQQAIINTYTAVSNALAVQPWFLGLALSAVALGLGLRNVATIKATPIYKDGGVIQGKRHSQGGVKVLGGSAEVEGGEFITNRISTMKNLPLLTYVNSQKKQLTRDDITRFFDNNPNKPSKAVKNVKKFAQGGELPEMNTDYLQRQVQQVIIDRDDRPVVVSVVDIINEQDNLRKVQTLAGLNN